MKQILIIMLGFTSTLSLNSMTQESLTIPSVQSLRKQNIKAKLESAIKERKASGKLTQTDLIKRDLGIVSRGIDNIKKDILLAVAKKPISGFNPATSLNNLQAKVNRTYRQLKSASKQQNAKALEELLTDITKFQDTVKKHLPSNLLMRLADLQSKIYIWTEKIKR